jgi:riboflavin kinase/FMN adenylyltransferase
MKIALTIGMFDGVHLGHRTLIQELKKWGKAVVVTFKNHPSTVIKAIPATPLISTFPHRLLLLKAAGADEIVALDFTPELAQTPFDEFLKNLKTPFNHLVLGEGAAFGRARGGNAEKVSAYSKTAGFEAHYISKIAHDNAVVSSGRIRAHIRAGELDEVSRLLGRPYSILATIIDGKLEIENLCLPPSGTYSVTINGAPHTARIEDNTVRVDTHTTQTAEIIFS